MMREPHHAALFAFDTFGIGEDIRIERDPSLSFS